MNSAKVLESELTKQIPRSGVVGLCCFDGIGKASDPFLLPVALDLSDPLPFLGAPTDPSVSDSVSRSRSAVGSVLRRSSDPYVVSSAIESIAVNVVDPFVFGDIQDESVQVCSLLMRPSSSSAICVPSSTAPRGRPLELHDAVCVDIVYEGNLAFAQGNLNHD